MEDPITERARTLIVIGAAAGGIAALNKVLASFTPALPATVVIVLHTAAGHAQGLIAEWNAHCQLPVAYAQGGEALDAGRVYVAPYDQHLEVSDDRRLRVSAAPRRNNHRPSADHLFESASQVYGPRSIGVVLTGANGDGAEGMQAIYACGGIGVVQEPSDSVNPSMPLTTLRTDHPRYCVPLRDIGELLEELAGRV